MASAQVVETSVNTNNSPSQDHTTNPDDHSNHNIDRLTWVQTFHCYKYYFITSNSFTYYTLIYNCVFCKCSSYQVIVLRMENDVATLPDDYENKLYNVTKAEQLGLPFYITAEIPGKNVTAKSSFSVGDGTTRGSYLNARLREGKQYKVFYRAMTDWKGVRHFYIEGHWTCFTVAKKCFKGQ